MEFQWIGAQYYYFELIFNGFESDINIDTRLDKRSCFSGRFSDYKWVRSTLDPGEIADGDGTLHGRTGAVQKLKAIDWLKGRPHTLEPERGPPWAPYRFKVKGLGEDYKSSWSVDVSRMERLESKNVQNEGIRQHKVEKWNSDQGHRLR